MNLIETYNGILNENNYLALATSVEGKANVRVVNYYENPAVPGVLYIRTKNDKQKVVEFTANPVVAFATIIKSQYEYIRVQNAVIGRCMGPLSEEIKLAFTKREPNFSEKNEGTIFFAIYFQSASVTINPTSPALTVRF
ncbi:MAG: pyridoxamine 5'-phosphate oxidase family protein [Carnobacterium alterfunditum]